MEGGAKAAHLWSKEPCPWEPEPMQQEEDIATVLSLTKPGGALAWIRARRKELACTCDPAALAKAP